MDILKLKGFICLAEALRHDYILRVFELELRTHEQRN